MASKALGLVISEFEKQGFEVEHLKDSIISVKKGGVQYKVFTKSLTKGDYTFHRKTYLELKENNYVVLVLYEIEAVDKVKAIYLMPSVEWREPDETFIAPNYEGKKSKPEYGIRVSPKHFARLDEFRFERMINKL